MPSILTRGNENLFVEVILIAKHLSLYWHVHIELEKATADVNSYILPLLAKRIPTHICCTH